MTHFQLHKTFGRVAVAALLGLCVAGADTAASKQPGRLAVSFGAAPEDEAGSLFAQGGCSAAASQAAAESGGQVLSVSTSQQGGQTVCIVTVLIPGHDGSRPRRKTITIPQ